MRQDLPQIEANHRMPLNHLENVLMLEELIVVVDVEYLGN